jgi:hypothetical protein
MNSFLQSRLDEAIKANPSKAEQIEADLTRRIQHNGVPVDPYETGVFFGNRWLRKPPKKHRKGHQRSSGRR